MSEPNEPTTHEPTPEPMTPELTMTDRLRRRALPIALGAIALILALVFHAQLLAWFTGGGESSTRSAQVRTEAGGLSIDAAIEPDPPRQGKNTLVVSLARGGEPVKGADVRVEVWMPAMGAMPEMRSKADVTEADPGVYRAEFELSMGGSWTATIDATTDGSSVTAEYGLTVGTSGLRASGAVQDGAAPGAAPALGAAPAPAYTFSDSGRASLLAALDAYEAVRAALANDSVAGVSPASALIVRALREAEAAEPNAPEPIGKHLSSAAVAGTALGESQSVEAARQRFSELSEHLVALAAADPALREGRHLFECPMWDGYNRWIQPSEELANPYMGTKMLTCGSESTWDAATGSAEPHVHDPDEISHYTCSMHPWVKEDDPDDTCPVCGMDLTPVTKGEVKEGIIRIDRDRRQAFGVRTAKVTQRRLTVPIHAVGRVAYDERRLVDVTLKYSGWIERLHVEETGERVKKGQPLFDIYSPQLFSAQHELILATRQAASATTEAQRSRAAALTSGARKRMRLWDLSNSQIDAIIAAGEPKERLTVRSPATGYVLEKDIVEGAAVEPGKRLYRIADLTRVWVEAEVYEQHVPLIEKGQGATVRLSNVAGQPVVGTVSFIHPTIDPRTRTARIRIELANDDFALKPDMFAEVDIKVDHGTALAVPEAAIVYSGPRRIVFVDIGQDRLRPTVIEVGVKSDGYVEVLKGLEAGDKVVVSGNFLVAAESRLKSATGIW